MKKEKIEYYASLVVLILGALALAYLLFAKLFNVILKALKKDPINPMIGAAGISAFPMSGRIVHKMGLEADNQNFLLMHAIGVNVSGQIASVIAGALVLRFFM